MSNAVVLGTAHGHVFGIAATARKVEGLEIAGVYDPDPDRLASAAEKLGVPAFATLDDALAEKPNLALLGAVPCDRAQLAIASMRAGAAVLTDKPLAVTHEALDAVIEAQRDTGRPLMVYYPYRGHPNCVAAKRALDEGRIGRLVRVMSCGPHKLNPAGRPDWHWTRAENGGAMIDIGSHHVDAVCWFAGQTPRVVTGLDTNLSQPGRPEFQDFAQAQLQFPDGSLGHVEVDWLNPASFSNFGDTRMWLQGTEGKIELRMGDEVSALIWTDSVAAEPLDTAGIETGEQWGTRLIERCIAGKPTDIPQDEIWRASRVTLAAFESARQGGAVVEVG